MEDAAGLNEDWPTSRRTAEETGVEVVDSEGLVLWVSLKQTYSRLRK